MGGRQSLHTIFIDLHASTAAVCFLLSLLLLFLPKYPANKALFTLYWWSLLGFLVFLLAAMGVYWPRYTLTEKWIFMGLLTLAGYMVYRASQAGRMPEDQHFAFIDHIGFNLISLFEGFIVVSLLNSAVWIIILAAVAGYIAGRYAISIGKHKNAVIGHK